MVVAVFFYLCGAFLVGSVPTAYLAGKLVKKVDIREYGSGNVGATNAFRTLGAVPGFTVLIIDFAKGFLAVTLLYGATKFSPFDGVGFLKIAFGIAVIAGHIFSVFLGFRAGKGVATWLGALFGINWPLFMVAAGILVVVIGFTRYMSLASLAGAFLVFVLTLPLYGVSPIFLFSLAAFVFIFVSHRKNIEYLLEGSETKLFQKRSPT